MRSALLCVLIALITTHIEENRADEDGDFRPTPIPLDYWNDRRAGRAGTLPQINKTDSPPSEAAAPAYYWEDALRHSVYLTLVRDKIDQLISTGAVISPNSKPDYASKEVDDHDLWEKIKMAPFDRLTKDDHITFGDVTIMSRGRLMNDKNGFRFAEDQASKEKCNDDKCMEGVKALWSVKRMRQREAGAPSGKYHYELTFSVTSQSSRKQRKPYENPVRTFTVRENPPIEPQHVYNISQKQRPQRAIWFHKNIVPTKHHHNSYNQGLDRIFSSFFSDEESYVESPRHKQQNPYVPQTFPQFSKAGYAGLHPDTHHQKRLMPYNVKPQSYKYSRPPLSAPPLSHIQPYIDFDSMSKSPYPPPPPPPPDHIRYQPSNAIKTTRPAVLPTPIMPIPQSSFSTVNNSTIDDINSLLNQSENMTREPEIITGFKGSNNPKKAPMKVSYFPDHVRPPVYNAPPGVFVTMDKKPFKPMPPLKLVHSSKPMRSKPVDFRPSPQVLDVQFSNPEAVPDSAFRPITINYSESKTTQKIVTNENNKKRKPSAHNKKNQKEHETKKTQSIITTTPEIITANNESEEDSESIEWANLLGAFTKTTPMVAYKDKKYSTESVAPVTSTTTSNTIAMNPEITEITTTSTFSTTTTVKPTKRTRPPPNFTKPEKIKKHKRITTTTTTTTTTKPPERVTVKKPAQDLTPQASSAATSRPSWKPKSKPITTTTPMTTSKSTSTTSIPSTTSTKTTTTTTMPTTIGITNDIEPATTQPKIKNRYRESTLMLKGTSIKHDRWSSSGIEKNKTLTPNKYPPRRKGSNFKGYVFPTRKTTEPERNKEEHPDKVSDVKTNNITKDAGTNTVERNSTSVVTETSQTTTSEKTHFSDDISTDLVNVEVEEFDEDADETSEENYDQESKDHTEYIFNVSTTPDLAEKINTFEEDKITTTELTITTSPYPVAKNKTKCKKKKKQNHTTTEGAMADLKIDYEPTTSTTTTTTEKAPTTDSFVDFFEEFIMNDKPKKTNDQSINVSTNEPELDEEESENHDIYVHTKDDFQMFMDSLEKDDEEYDDDDSEDYSPFNNVEENSEARNSDSDYTDYQDRSFGLLELMPME